MKTRRNRKAAGRRMLSFLLAAALLFTMLPVSGVQKAKAVGYCVKYSEYNDDSGAACIEITEMADDYSDFIVGGTLELPSEIEGKPVKRIAEGMLLMIEGAEKVVFPDSIEDAGETAMVMFMGDVKEFHIKNTGNFKLPVDKYASAYIDFLSGGTQTLTDVYFYAYDVNDIKNITYHTTQPWEKEVTAPITFHVGSQNIVDKFYADEIYKQQIDAGRLIVTKDLEVEYDGRLFLPSMISDAEKQYTSDMENDYNKASWAALQTALADAKSVTEETSDEEVLRIVDALQSALAGMVSVKSLAEAIAAAEPYEQEKDTYTNSTWIVVASALEAARNVPEDVTSERAAELAKSLTDAVKALRKKAVPFLTIRCDNVIFPATPVPIETGNQSGGEVSYEYFKDQACEIPVNAEDPSQPPTEPGEYYVRGTSAITDQYLSAVSQPCAFEIYGRSGEGWSLSDEGVLTITDVNALESDTHPWQGVNPEVVSVVLADGVEPARLGNECFSKCGKLKSFTIPDSVKSLGNQCFYAAGLEQISIPAGVTSIGDDCFRNGKFEKIVVPDSVTSIGTYCFAYSKLTEITLSAGLEELPAYLLYSTGVKECVVPEGVTSIGNSCFAETELESVTLPEGLKTIGDEAFSACPALKILEIPSSVESLGTGVFRLSRVSGSGKKTGIQQLVIPEGVTAIGADLFEGCDKLSYVIIKGKEYTAEDLGGMGKMFLGVPETAVVLCDGQTYDTLDAYSKTLKDDQKWPEGILRKLGEYTVEQKQAYQGEKEGISSLKEADYTADTWNSLQAAIARAEALSTAEGEDFEIALNQVAARRALAEGIIPCLQETAAKVREVLAGEDMEKDYDMEADSWWALQDALEDADKMAEEGVADAADLLAGMQAIKDAHAGLTLKSAEDAKKTLEDAVASAKALVASDYTPESWKVLQDAIAEAEAEKASGKNSRIEAAQKKVDEAVAALGKMPADEAKAALEAAVATVTKDLKEADYTPESWKALQDALKEAEGIKGTGTISQIQAAQKKVEDAAAALKKKEENKPSASPSTSPSTNPSTAPSTKPTASPDAKPTASPGSQPTKNPGGVNATQKPGGSDKSDKITVKKVTIKKAKSTKKKTITVQWKKVAGVTGYQVQLGTNKKVTKGKKTYTVKKAKTVKKTIKKLKRKKKYYVRVRAFKTVKGKKYYGKWSKVKNVKTK